MGLTNSCAYFQKLLDTIMKGLDSNTKCYIDDIVVFSQTHEEHLQHLEEVLKRLQKHGLKCASHKMQIAAREIKYLGYDIRPGQNIRPNKLKVAAVEEWRECFSK